MGKQQQAERWSQIAADFDQIGPPFFAHTGRRLVELVHLSRSAVVLDVAAGRGAVLFPAAEQVGGHGRILSIDLAAGMTQALAADVKHRGLHQANVCQMDAEQLALADASCDAVLCAHAIFYFPQAMDAFYRVLRPGGWAGLSIVAQGNFDWLWQVFATYADADEPATPDEPAINSPEGLQALLHRAGFDTVQTRAEAVDCVYADEEMWWANLWALGTRSALEKMSPDIRGILGLIYSPRCKRSVRPMGCTSPTAHCTPGAVNRAEAGPGHIAPGGRFVPGNGARKAVVGNGRTKLSSGSVPKSYHVLSARYAISIVLLGWKLDCK